MSLALCLPCPITFHSFEVLLSIIVQGLPQQAVPGFHSVMPASGPRPHVHNSVGSFPDGAQQPLQNNLQNQQNEDKQGTKVATNEDSKVILYICEEYILFFLSFTLLVMPQIENIFYF